MGPSAHGFRQFFEFASRSDATPGSILLQRPSLGVPPDPPGSARPVSTVAPRRRPTGPSNPGVETPGYLLRSLRDSGKMAKLQRAACRRHKTGAVVRSPQWSRGGAPSPVAARQDLPVGISDSGNGRSDRDDRGLFGYWRGWWHRRYGGTHRHRRRYLGRRRPFRLRGGGRRTRRF